MRLERFIQWIVLAVIWVSVGIVLLVSTFVALLAGWAISPWWIITVLFIGVILTGTFLSSDRFEHLNRQIEDQLSGLSDAEMLEVMQAMDEVKDSIGIHIELPLKNKKRKREEIDQALRNMSDTELLHLKERLRDGDIDEEKLMAWLDEQREQAEYS